MNFSALVEHAPKVKFGTRIYFWILVSMNEIAPGAVWAVALPGESMAGSSFVWHLIIIVAFQLRWTVGELAFAAVGTRPLLHEVSAKWAFSLRIEIWMNSIVEVIMLHLLFFQLVTTFRRCLRQIVLHTSRGFSCSRQHLNHWDII